MGQQFIWPGTVRSAMIPSVALRLTSRPTSVVMAESFGSCYQLFLPPDVPFSFREVVNFMVAWGTQGNQIFFRIVPCVAAKFFVVNLKTRHRAAQLTSPAVTTQHLLPQTLVRCRMQRAVHGFRTNRACHAFSRRLPRNACCCSSGRN